MIFNNKLGARRPTHLFYSVLITIAILAVILSVSYIQHANYLKNNLVLDVGSQLEEANGISKLSPSQRVSEKKAVYIDDNLITYRDLLEPLVYTNVNVPPKWSSFDIEITFKDNFPTEEINGIKPNSNFKLGVKNGPEWDYKWYTIYSKNLNLTGYNMIEQDGIYLYMKNDSEQYETVEAFMADIPDTEIVVANDIIKNEFVPMEYEEGEFFLDTQVRGDFDLLVHAKGDLVGSFSKIDLNAYEGADVYNISLLDKNRNVIKTLTYEDDGEVNKTKAEIKQDFAFVFSDLELDYYYIEFDYEGKGSDSSIENLKLNQKKVVIDTKDNYFLPLKEFKFYTLENSFNIQTWHAESFQKVKIANRLTSVRVKDKVYSVNTQSGVGVVPNGDIVIKSKYPIALDEESYFYPYVKKMATVSDFSYQEYVVLNNMAFETEYEHWKKVSYNVLSDGLSFDDSISVIMKTEHLEQETFINHTISISDIEVRFNE